MFSIGKGEESVCTIGVPNRAPVTSLNSVRAAATCIGGQAVWNDALMAPAEGTIKCGNCNDNTNMVLVSQIYAPLEYDRTLYVFCCNTRACSLVSTGWVVVRNQEKKKVEVPAVNCTAPTSAWSDFVTPTETKLASKVASAWGDFSFDEGGTDESVDALTALLEERDLLLTEKVVDKKIASTPKANVASSTQRYVTVQQLPCWEVSELEESWTLADEEAAWEGLSAEDDAVLGSGADSEHINRLLKSYFEGEEDVEIVNIVKKQQAGGAQKASTQVSAEEESRSKKNEKTTQGKQTSSKHHSDQNEEEGSDGEGNESGLSRSSRRQQVEAYFQRRVFFYPTQVLRYAYGGAPLWISHPSPLDADATQSLVSVPTATTPITPTSSAIGTNNTEASEVVTLSPEAEEDTVFQFAASKKAKKNKATSGAKKGNSKDDAAPVSRIPRCESCGQARVFECQLMPALLSYISSGNSSSNLSSSNAASTKGKQVEAPTAAASTGASSGVAAAWSLDNPPSAADIQRFQESLGQGLDFGVVAIYSCPDSCDNSREVAIVQGPPDIL